MANVATYAEQLGLLFLLRGSTATTPAAWGVGLSLGAPTSVSGSEIAQPGSGYVRKAASFASQAVGTFTNATAMTFGPFSSGASISGLQIWDNSSTASADAPNLMWYGLLTTARTVGVGDSLVIASGALTITLS